METESFELKVLDIVEETGDARSVSFEVPEGQEETFRYKRAVRTTAVRSP
jgi:3-ketosteroid 9alpha-monooxygenase subunit B